MKKYYYIITLPVILFFSCKKEGPVEPDPVSYFGSWQLKPSSLVSKRTGHVGVSVNGKGYVGLGLEYGFVTNYLHDWWEYDPTNDGWTQKAAFPGNSSAKQKAFATLTKAYVIDSGRVYSYNPANNAWTQLNDFPGPRLCTFLIGTDSGAFMGMAYTDSFPHTPINGWWSYTESTDQWVQKSDFPGSGVGYPVGFVVNNKIYIGMGTYTVNLNEYFDYKLWAYSIIDDQWNKVGHIPEFNESRFGFTLNGKGYFAGGGLLPETLKVALMEYDPASNTWKLFYDIKFSGGVSFIINKKVYLFQNYDKYYIDNTSIDDKFWQLTP